MTVASALVPTALTPLVQDTTGAAYVPRAGGPPDTSGYMWGGYAVGVVILLGYLLLLLRRQARERRHLDDARGA